jgi:ABC-type transport system substrate-binding protein
MTLAFNLQRDKLANRRVREAFAVSIDRTQMLERVVFGQGRVAAAPIGSGVAWAHAPDALANYRPDLAKANRLLDEAGLIRDAKGLRATFDITHFPAFSRYTDLMRQQLSAVGIGLRVKTVDPAAFAQSVFSVRDFDLALISYYNGTDPEIGVRRMVHSSSIGQPSSVAISCPTSRLKPPRRQASYSGVRLSPKPLWALSGPVTPSRRAGANCSPTASPLSIAPGGSGQAPPWQSWRPAPSSQSPQSVSCGRAHRESE